MPSPDITIHADQTARSVSRHGVSLREDTVYTNHKGREKRGIRKRTDKALSKLAEVLPKVLEPEETILYVAQVQAPASVFEQLAFGWYIYYVTRTVLVFTNRRMLHFQVKRDGDWKQILRSVRWGDVEHAKVKGWLLSPTLWLKYRTGKKETYWALRRDDAKKIKLLLAALLPNSSGELSPAQQMVSLCPDCTAVLTPKTYQCNQCGLTFKDEWTAIRLSLLYPGGGYMYTGHWFLAVGDAFVEAVLLAEALVYVLVALGMPEPGLGPLDPSASRGEALAIAGVFATILAVEKWFTIHHARRFVREYLPIKKKEWPVNWKLRGLFIYLLVAFTVWDQTPHKAPLIRIAPDLVVVSAQFGLFQNQPDGTYNFQSTISLPLVEGQEYGWILRVNTSRQEINLREEYYFLIEAAAAGGSSPSSGLEPVAVIESDVAPLGGLIINSWKVEAGEPTGERSIKVFIDETLVREFVFQVR